MKNRLSAPFEVSNFFKMNTIVSVEELANYDMIYIYHHLQVGTRLELRPSGTNVKGDLRYEVAYKNFKLGYITLTGGISSVYENAEAIHCEIAAIDKRKFMPVKGLDISMQATKMRMVS